MGENLDVPNDSAADLLADRVGDRLPDVVPDVPVETPPDIVVDTTPDLVVDRTPDIVVDTTPDPVVDQPPASGCMSGTDTQVFAGGAMVGCAGRIGWSESQNLCASGWLSCSAAQWVELRGGVAPTHNYWTSDELHYNGWERDCWVQLEGGGTCNPASSPMRVCVDHTDPLGNECNWTNCSFRTSGSNEYFGGCNGNDTAGTLCCR